MGHLNEMDLESITAGKERAAAPAKSTPIRGDFTPAPAVASAPRPAAAPVKADGCSGGVCGV